MKLKKLALCGLLAVCSAQASATEILKYNGSPLKIQLSTNQQRLVRMPDNAYFRIPDSLKDTLHITSVAGVLYVESNDDINDVPVEARLNDSGEIVKMLVSSSKDAKDTDDEVRVVMPWENDNAIKVGNQQPKNVLPAANGTNAVDSDNGVTIRSKKNVGANELIRYAAMRDFMPMRLWESNSQIQEAPALKNINLDGLFYGKSTGVFDSHIESSYRAGDNYLYVITLKNKMPFAVDIKFDDLAIDFTNASVPEPYYSLGAIGSKNDFSYLYLVTKVDIKTLMRNIDPNSVKE